MGTEDRTLEGWLPIDEFARLARLAVAEDWFGLNDDYADPQVQDGRWSLLRLERSDGSVKQVFRRAGAGPQALDNIEAAIDAARQRIRFQHPPK